MISTYDDHMSAAGLRDFVKKRVVKCLCGVAGGGAVKYITRYEQAFYLLLLNFCNQPVEEGFKFARTSSTIQSSSQMPI